jgi:DnaK suppressor protein
MTLATSATTPATASIPTLGMYDILTSRFDEAYAMWRQQEDRVLALRDDVNTLAGDDVDHATANMQLDEEAMLAESLRNQLADLAIARQRCLEGSYGVCEGCQQPILAERLEIFPAATLCVPCKSAASRR